MRHLSSRIKYLPIALYIPGSLTTLAWVPGPEWAASPEHPIGHHHFQRLPAGEP